jgi:hypothetical protein
MGTQWCAAGRMGGSTSISPWRDDSADGGWEVERFVDRVSPGVIAERGNRLPAGHDASVRFGSGAVAGGTCSGGSRRRRRRTCTICCRAMGSPRWRDIARAETRFSPHAYCQHLQGGEPCPSPDAYLHRTLTVLHRTLTVLHRTLTSMRLSASGEGRVAHRASRGRVAKRADRPPAGHGASERLGSGEVAGGTCSGESQRRRRQPCTSCSPPTGSPRRPDIARAGTRFSPHPCCQHLQGGEPCPSPDAYCCEGHLCARTRGGSRVV